MTVKTPRAYIFTYLCIMLYLYVKSMHIIFVVTWFAAIFYMPRLFIYTTEAHEKTEPERSILIRQLLLMQNRLWTIIAWPSAILTLIFGVWMGILYSVLANWLIIKIGFVFMLYLYFLFCHRVYLQQKNHIFTYTSMQLRIWNEVSTVLLFAIVFLVVVKTGMSWLSGIIGLLVLMVLLMAGIKLYKILRERNEK